jgi:hypothetical protein
MDNLEWETWIPANPNVNPLSQPFLAGFSLLTGNLTGNFSIMRSNRRIIAGPKKTESISYQEVPKNSQQRMSLPKQGTGVCPLPDIWKGFK